MTLAELVPARKNAKRTFKKSKKQKGATSRKRRRLRKDQNSLEEDLQYSDNGSSVLEEVEQKDTAEGLVQLSVQPGRYIDEQTEENTTLPSRIPKKRRGASPSAEKDKDGDKEKEKSDPTKEKPAAKLYNAVTQSELEDLKEPFEQDNDLLPMGEPAFDISEFLIKREVRDEPPPVNDDLVDIDQHSTNYTFPTVVKVEPIEPDMHMDLPMMHGTSIEPPQFKEEPPEDWQPDPAIQDTLQVTDSEEEAED